MRRAAGWLARNPYLPYAGTLAGLAIALGALATGGNPHRWEEYLILAAFAGWVLMAARVEHEGRHWHSELRRRMDRTLLLKSDYDSLLDRYRAQCSLMATEHADMAGRVKLQGRVFADKLRHQSAADDMTLCALVLEGLWLVQNMEAASDDPLDDIELTLTAAALSLSELDRELAP